MDAVNLASKLEEEKSTFTLRSIIINNNIYEGANLKYSFDDNGVASYIVN